MHNISSWLQRYLISTAFIVGLAGFGNSALADTYNIILKQSGTPLDCATGGFEFTKDGTAGWKTPSNPSLHINAGCISGLPDTSFAIASASFKVILQNVSLNNQAQGVNVVGLASNLAATATGQGVGRTVYKIHFSYTGPYSTAIRDFRITKTTGTVATGQTTTVVAEGTYFVRNTNLLPEPETLLLLFAGAAGLMLVKSRKSRRKA